MSLFGMYTDQVVEQMPSFAGDRLAKELVTKMEEME